MDQVIEGKIYNKGSFEDCCIGIKDGKIVEIKKILKADKHLKIKNKIILPAGIDVHVHFRDPGMTNKEDFKTGSKSAAYGGISCVFDMPNTIPQTTTLEALSAKIDNADKKSYIDFGLYAGITDDNLDKIEKLGKKSNGFKVYLGSTTLSLLFDKDKIHEALELAGVSTKPVLFHCEDEECLIQHKQVKSNLSDHMRFRPSLCEEISIKKVIEDSKGLSTKVHICHVSSCDALELLKNRPMNVSFGITPHHSLFNVKKDMGSQSLFKVNPPIRTSFDKESLFNALINGSADNLESDHAPHTLDEKDVDFDVAPSGVPGVETIYPLFLYLAKKQVISFQRLVSLMCNKPADLVGIPKGRIQPGYDADFIAVDLKDECRIKAENLHSRCGWTPFEDWSAIFPKTVFIRGEKVIDSGEIQVKQGFGEFVGA